MGGGGAREPIRLPPIEDWPPLERLGFEADAIGFHLTAHPLDVYGAVLRRLGVVASNALAVRPEQGRVKLAGVVVGSKERITSKGSRMAWVRLSDPAGTYEITVFSEVLARCRDLLTEGGRVLATVELRSEGDALRITAHDIVSLEDVVMRAGGEMRVWLHETAAVEHIRTLLGREGKGRGRVVLVPRIDAAQTVEIELPGGYAISPRLALAIKVIPGVDRVEEA